LHMTDGNAGAGLTPLTLWLFWQGNRYLLNRWPHKITGYLGKSGEMAAFLILRTRLWAKRA